MGLLLGCSVLSILEIIDHFLLCCCFKDKKKKKHEPDVSDLDHPNMIYEPRLNGRVFASEFK